MGCLGKSLQWLLVLLSLILPRVRASDSLLSPKGVNYEVAALMSVKSKLRDVDGVLEGWDINSVDPCTWSLVACSPQGFVISLEMTSKSLSGVLSPSIGNLSHLQTLLLQNNDLSGSVPVEIGKLLELQALDLSGNQFVGEIPSSLGFLIHLSYLRLSKNNLSGKIPIAVANLTVSFFVAGNVFLCTASFLHGCMDMRTPVKQTNLPQEHSNHRLVVATAVGLSCALTVTFLLLICWLHWCRWHTPFASHVQQDYNFAMGHLKRFSFRELQVATDNFNVRNLLGQGGFGVVYKGVLRNGTVVAVKRLKDPNFTGEVQFQTEVEMIGLALHRNLLRLYGFCMTSNERLLVYPYMLNGSVADRLRDPCCEKPTLDWNKRMQIALGAARGLLYLHEQCNPKIIHRDVKAANILLDESFEAVVGDFGLAKLLDRRDSHVTTAVRGTLGHIAPEYLSTGQSSEKTDVFGFGILLLELVTGHKALDTGNGLVPKGMILDWVRTVHQEKRLEVLVDRDLKNSFNVDEVDKAVEVAILCTQSNPNLRPKMSEVEKVLEAVAGPGEHMEEFGGGTICERTSSFPGSFSNFNDESSFIIEAMELSGPR